MRGIEIPPDRKMWEKKIKPIFHSIFFSHIFLSDARLNQSKSDEQTKYSEAISSHHNRRGSGCAYLADYQ
jgi:hypothetical protein